MKTKSGINPLSITKYWKDLKPPDIQYLRATKNKFYDNTFPPTLNTLYSKNSKGEFMDKVRGPEKLKDFQEDVSYIQSIVWKRVTEVSPKWELFEGKIEINDVEQGSLGDCYFLSSIAALAGYPYLIKEKFRTKGFNQEGYYEMIFFIDGEWQIVFIDDYLPYDTSINNFAFAKPNNNELWVMFLEKAWAKLNGGYSNIISGLENEVIFSLTGFPSDLLFHDDFDEMEIYNKIEEGEKEGTIMCSGTKNNNEIESRGLIASHAYTLMTAKKWKDRNIFLIKLRNPWGVGEWNGKWGDNSSCWTEEYKKYFNYKKCDDGVFWIDIDDFVQNFDFTYICYILYGAIVKNFYFEYQTYFKKPVVFNMRVKEKGKMSIGVLFKNWRFNRDIHDFSHPFSMVVCKYDQNRRIEKLWNKWSYENDIYIIDFFEPGLYVIWLYLAYNEIKDPKFKYTVQISSLAQYDIEFLGLDKDYLLIQYLLLENYKKVGENNISSSENYFIGPDREISKNGINNILLYNKTGRELDITVCSKKVANVQLLPPYEGLTNLNIKLPPYESIAIIGVRLTNKNIDFIYNFQLSYGSVVDKNEDPERWKKNNGDKFSNLLKLNIISNNPETMGLRTGEYKFIGKSIAQLMPKLDASRFNGQTILQQSLTRTEKITLEYLKKIYPKEIEILLKTFPINKIEQDKIWNYTSIEEGKYAGQINAKTGIVEGKGVFIWNKGIKYIGNWKENNMHGNGMILDKNNKFIFQGIFYHNKKYGRGKLKLKENEFYDGEFFDDKMEGKGCYYYSNGDIWEGYFKHGMKHGVGIMTYKINNEIYLYEFENDYYMGSIPLSAQEKERVKNLQQEEKKKLLEDEKKKLTKKFSEYITKKNSQEQKENVLSKYTSKLYLQKSFFNFDAKITQSNQNFGVNVAEQRHKIFLSNLDLYKKKEPFLMEKFLELRPLNYEEELILLEKDGKKYLGGFIKSKDGKNTPIMQGRGVLFNSRSYYAGYWDNNCPNGYFHKYNTNRVIVFKGFLLKDFSVDPKRIAKVYFDNRDSYKGYFINNQMNGFGIYYYKGGSSFTGNFNNGSFDGTGKYFHENGLLTEIITYQKGKVVSKTKKIREDLRDPNSINFFNDIKKNHPGVIEHILIFPPLRDVPGELFWTKTIFNNGDIYIGQVNSKKELCGRCCITYPHSSKTYFVGYIKNKEFTGEGAYYDRNWKKIYQGNFEHNLKNGYGIWLREDGNTYSGQFINGKPNGKGILYYQNGMKFEGHFINGFQNDKGYLISPDNTVKQEIIYKNGNIIEQGEIMDYKKTKYQKLYKQQFNEFEKECKKLGYEKYMNLLINIKSTKETFMLKYGIKEEMDGIYIGEMNSIGFKYGRGVFIDNSTKMYYVGYFVNNEKQGYGVNYYPDGKPQYIGEYRRDKTYGNGEFRYKNGTVLRGNFNYIGEGNGIYIFEDRTSWKGSFYAWTLNGTGMLYAKDGRCLGEKSYEYNIAINK